MTNFLRKFEMDEYVKNRIKGRIIFTFMIK